MIRAREPGQATGGEYTVMHDSREEIMGLACLYSGCTYSATRLQFKRGADRSGLARYNRMRAAMMRHWRDCHSAARPS